jgi:hypothetical protein
MRQGQIECRGSQKAVGRLFRAGARRSSNVNAAVMRIARLRYEMFRARFGRDPYPDEPLFFDPSRDTPVVAEVSEMWTQVLDAASATRTDALSVMKFLGLA